MLYDAISIDAFHLMCKFHLFRYQLFSVCCAHFSWIECWCWLCIDSQHSITDCRRLRHPHRCSLLLWMHKCCLEILCTFFFEKLAIVMHSQIRLHVCVCVRCVWNMNKIELYSKENKQMRTRTNKGSFVWILLWWLCQLTKLDLDVFTSIALFPSC